jgi:hypothetical protein
MLIDINDLNYKIPKSFHILTLYDENNIVLADKKICKLLKNQNELYDYGKYEHVCNYKYNKYGELMKISGVHIQNTLTGVIHELKLFKHYCGTGCMSCLYIYFPKNKEEIHMCDYKKLYIYNYSGDPLNSIILPGLGHIINISVSPNGAKIAYIKMDRENKKRIYKLHLYDIKTNTIIQTAIFNPKLWRVVYCLYGFIIVSTYSNKFYMMHDTDISKQYPLYLLLAIHKLSPSEMYYDVRLGKIFLAQV